MGDAAYLAEEARVCSLRKGSRTDQCCLEVKNLVKHFAGLVAVNDISFEVREGEILSIVGPNGAGKSVLFGLISGMLRPTHGQVLLQGEEITGFKPLPVAHRGIARTFQTTALFDQLRVVDNLAIGFRLRTPGASGARFSTAGAGKKTRTKQPPRSWRRFNLSVWRTRPFHFVSTLSQAEQKRLSIGVALISQPKMILLDEPTGGLIVEDTDQITDLIRKIHEQRRSRSA